jgi:hypothetical protein
MIRIKEVTKHESREKGRGGFLLASKKVRIYFSVEGENVLQNLVLRQSRPNKLYRKFLPEVLEKMGFATGTKAYWDQHAGCSCPCSPGFVVQSNEYRGWVIWVTLEGDEEAQLDPKKTSIAAQRMAQVLSDPTLLPLFDKGSLAEEVANDNLIEGEPSTR